MMMKLTLFLRASVGKNTQRLDKIMREFKPSSQSHIINTLKTIEHKKEYISRSTLHETFINRIQYFLLKQTSTFNSQTLHIYQLIKRMSMITPTFKYGILKCLTKQMQRIIDQNLNIKNNQLEVLLWFIYRQYPSLRQTKFQQIASDHTLRLFQILEFMNAQKKIPIWEPYLRISTMLKALGHQPQTRKDITLKQIQDLQYTYYPFLASIFDTETSRRQFNEKTKLFEPLIVHLCNKFIDRDQIRYNTYLRHVEQIDNEDVGQDIEETTDSLLWSNFAQFLQLYCKCCEGLELDNNLAYKINEVFWRLCQSKDVQLQSGIQMFSIISQNPNLLGEHQFTIVSRIKDIFFNLSTTQYRFLPSPALIKLFQAMKLTKRFSQQEKSQFYDFLADKCVDIIFWEEGDKAKVLQFLKENRGKPEEKIQKFLSNP